VRKTIAAVAALAFAVPAIALAASPAKDSHFKWCPQKDMCPLDFDTNKAGTKIVNMSLYPKCAPVPVGKGSWPAMKVKDGKFSAAGTVKDVVGRKITYTISGKFKKPKKAVGTFDVDRKDCSDTPHAFTAKRDGKAQGSPF
jgi:hypothetical protein